MKLAAQPGTTTVEFYPPAYRTPQHLADVDRRFQLFLTYLIQRHVFFNNLLTRLIQTIRGLLIPLLASQRELKSQLLRLYLGKNIFNHPNLISDHYTDLFMFLSF